MYNNVMRCYTYIYLSRRFPQNGFSVKAWVCRAKFAVPKLPAELPTKLQNCPADLAYKTTCETAHKTVHKIAWLNLAKPVSTKSLKIAYLSLFSTFHTVPQLRLNSTALTGRPGRHGRESHARARENMPTGIG